MVGNWYTGWGIGDNCGYEISYLLLLTKLNILCVIMES